MNAKELEEKYGITADAIEASAAIYESAEQPHCSNEIHSGSHLDAVGQQRVTVIYPAADVQSVKRLAKSRGVKPSAIYRDAMSMYLSAQRAS